MTGTLGLSASTVITMDAERRVISDGAVVIQDGIVVAVGAADMLRERYPHLDWLAAPDGVVLPGFVDAHGHAGHSFTRTVGSGWEGAWAQTCESTYARAADEDTWRLDALLLGLDRLRNGATTGVTFLGGGGAPLTGDMVFRSDSTAAAEAHLNAIRTLGTRAVLGVGPRRPPQPRAFVTYENGTAAERIVDEETQLAVCAAVVDRWHGAADGRIRIALTSHTAHPESGEGEEALEELLAQTRRILAIARERRLLFMQDGHGRGTVALLHERGGGLGPDVLLSHATDLLDEEIALIAETRAAVSHNPSAIASSLARCPVPELLRSDARVAIASDGPGADRGCDLLRHLQIAMRLQRAALRDPKVLPEGQALASITIEAAHAVGLGAEIGSLEVGKRGDAVIVGADVPHLTPMLMPVHQVVDYASGADIHTVVVNGEIVMRDRKVLTVDESAVLAEARNHAAVLMDRSGPWQIEPAPGFWGTVQNASRA